jgi:excinuclease ABC subunit A
MRQQPCAACDGERLNKEARFVTLDGVRFPEVTDRSIGALLAWIRALKPGLDEQQRAIGGELIAEIEQRLQFICDVGLHYLSLDRPAPTLSAGEAQRIRLASQIGSELVGVLYVLDEPSIGLHSRDQKALLDLLGHLRNLGNTVLVVEHDADAMRAADWLIDHRQHALHPRRADHRPALCRHPEAVGHSAPVGGCREHSDGDRAQPGRGQDRRLDRRPRTGGWG